MKVVLFNSLTKKGILMTLKSTRDMIEKVKENEMTSVDSVDYLRGLKDEDSVLISPRNFLPNTGGGCTEADLSNGKWYRIAIGYPGNAVSSGLFNIGNLFVNEPGQYCFMLLLKDIIMELSLQKLLLQIHFLYRKLVCYMQDQQLNEVIWTYIYKLPV